MPAEFKLECDLAGLFSARGPQFSQLFFHNFQGQELEKMVGQRQGSTVSHRGAQAFLKSGVRPESTCGLSNVWYEYVRRNRALFEEPDAPFPSRSSPPPGLHLEEQQLSHLWRMFQWEEQHGRPLPTKRNQTVSTSVELQDEISEFSDRSWEEDVDGIMSSGSVIPDEIVEGSGDELAATGAYRTGVSIRGRLLRIVETEPSILEERELHINPGVSTSYGVPVGVVEGSGLTPGRHADVEEDGADGE
jgi:hypothetical protein